jgi:manganese transport protein
MLTGLPLIVGAICSAVFSAWMFFSKNYQRLEKWIMGLVVIGLNIALLVDLAR